jgi:phosphate-selective porin OprO and OprP
MLIRGRVLVVRRFLEAVLAFSVSLVFVAQSSAQKAGASSGDVWKAPKTPQAKAKPPVFSREGLWIAKKDNPTVVRVHGYLQGDGRFFVTNLNDRAYDRLLFRRVRPLVEGKLANFLDFRFMPDFGEGNRVIQEVYVENGSIPFARLRAGKFKTPIGLEVLRSDRELTFAERSLASDLVPLRDLGIQADGSILHGGVRYEFGFFSGTGDGTNAKFQWRGTHEEVGRVMVKPFAEYSAAAMKQLGIGIAASDGHNHGALPSFKSVGQQTFFIYSAQTVSIGRHRRIAPQAYYFYGPLGVLAEYTISSQNVSAGSQHRPLSNTGWQVAGSFALTGEKNSYDGFHPAHNLEFSHGTHHWGAWEFVARHSELTIDPRAFQQFAAITKSSSGAHESAAGISWYLNRMVKLLSDYEYTTFPASGENTAHLPIERVMMTRLQLMF